MNLVELSRVLGGSLFADEYRGDFEQLAAISESDGVSNGRGETNRLKQNVLLRNAAFWTLSGNHAKTRQWLQRMKLHTGGGGNRDHGRKVCEMLSLINRLHPPAIRFRSQLGGSASIIHEAENEPLLSELRSSKSTQEILDQEQFGLSIPLRVYHYDIYLWTMQCQHPQYARPEYALGSSEMLSAIGSPFPQGYIESAARLGLTALASSLKLLQYEAEVARFAVVPESRFTEISEHFEKSQDLVGEALCLLKRADSLSSPGFTSPLALNLVVEGKLTGMVNNTWDLEEPKFALRANASAENLYQNALHLMEAAGSQRGCASILLRQAAILHMEALSLGEDRKIQASRLLNEALLKLQEALRGLKGDEANTCLSNCHQVLLDVTQRSLGLVQDGDSSTIITRAAEIGHWGKSADNTVLSQFCGLLMLRFGRRMLLDHSYLDAALLCTSCAKEVFRASDDKPLLLQALLAETDLIHASGNFAQAELVLRDARSSLDTTLHYLKELGGTSNTARDNLKGPIANLLMYYDSITSKVLVSAADPDGLQQWRNEYSKLEFEVTVDAFFTLSDESTPQGTVYASSGNPLDIRAILQEQADNQKLGEVYNTRYNAAYAELEAGNIDGFDSQLVQFLAATDSLRAPRDQLATFRIVANASLGLFEDARDCHLPNAVPRLFGRTETNLIETMLRRVNFQGVDVDNSAQIDRNQAERGISLCFLSQGWRAGWDLFCAVNQSVPGFLNLNNATVRGYDWKLDSWIGAILEHNGRLDDALKWYLRALRIMETYRSRNADAAARAGSQTSIHGAELFSGLIRVALSFSSHSSGHQTPKALGLQADTWTEQALVFTEQSSARTLLEFIMSQPELVKSSPQGAEQLEQWAEYTYLKRQIADLSTLPAQRVPEAEREGLRRELASLTEQLNKVEQNKTAVAQLPQTTQALLRASRFNISTKTLFSTIPLDAVVIEINMSRSGIVVFCITSEGIQGIHQSRTSSIQMRRQILKYLKDISEYQKAMSNPLARLGPTAAAMPPPLASIEELNQKAARIADEVIGAFTEIIAQKDHVVFVPSQEFNIFPLSALMYAGGPLFLSKAVSQVPSLATLAQLKSTSWHDASEARQDPTVSTIFNTHERRRAPRQPPPNNTPQPTPAPMVGISALVTWQLFQVSSSSSPPPIFAPSTTDATFRATYESSDIVVLSTHGTRSTYSPWQSHITLAPREREFRVMEVSRLRTRAACVLFGACLSAAGRVTQGNDVQGFSHAVLQSGARSYIGALWSVSDYVTMLLVVAFFRALVGSREDGSASSLASCWAYAQRVVYNLDATSAVEMLLDIQAVVTSIDPDTDTDVGVKEALGRTGLTQLARMIADLKDGTLKTNFRHPYHWAPFGIVGDGGLCLYGEGGGGGLARFR